MGRGKPLFFLGLCFAVILTRAAQGAEVETRGWIELTFFPPHNEYDPHPNEPFERRVVARYMLSGRLEAHLRKQKVFLFMEPALLLGDSRPQLDYNYKADPIALNARYGIGYELSESIQLRLTHSEWVDAGGYFGEKLVWNGLSIRYTFGPR